MNIRTWTQGGGVWLAEFESGADGVDSIEGGWLDVQPELAEEACTAIRSGVAPFAQEMRTGELGRGLTTVALLAAGQDLSVQVFSGPLDDVADEHFGGVDSGEWGGGGASDAMDQWDGIDEDPDQRLDGIDDGGPGDLF